MAVVFPPTAEQQQLAVTEQQEEQAKRKPDKKGKRIRAEKWLETDAGEYNSNPFRLAGIDIPKSFFTKLVDPTSDLSDELSLFFELHMEVGIYFLSKKYCYHLPSYSKSRCAVTDLEFEQYTTKLASIHPSEEQKEKIRKRKEKRMEDKKKRKSKRKRTSKKQGNEDYEEEEEEEEEAVIEALTDFS
ncbi:FK506-binding protein 3-like [Nicotiana sylvestris]|uniref:FK506-binding protein 3-like n=1 Tax=Nicotiana sylvestris TaxID=4096 RepID=UPI00388CD366